MVAYEFVAALLGGADLPSATARIGMGEVYSCPGGGSFANPYQCPPYVKNSQNCNQWCQSTCPPAAVRISGLANLGGVCICRYGDGGSQEGAAWTTETGVCTMDPFIPGVRSECTDEWRHNTLTKPTAIQQAARANLSYIAGRHIGDCYKATKNCVGSCACPGDIKSSSFENNCRYDYPNGGRACVMDIIVTSEGANYSITNARWFCYPRECSSKDMEIIAAWHSSPSKRYTILCSPT
jgi:hypothetical protein